MGRPNYDGLIKKTLLVGTVVAAGFLMVNVAKGGAETPGDTPSEKQDERETDKAKCHLDLSRQGGKVILKAVIEKRKEGDMFKYSADFYDSPDIRNETTEELTVKLPTDVKYAEGFVGSIPCGHVSN